MQGNKQLLQGSAIKNVHVFWGTLYVVCRKRNNYFWWHLVVTLQVAIAHLTSFSFFFYSQVA